jgi:hypothetical protein
MMMIEFQHFSQIVNTTNCSILLKSDYKKYSYIDVCVTLIYAQVSFFIYLEENSAVFISMYWELFHVILFQSLSSTLDFPRRII